MGAGLWVGALAHGSTLRGCIDPNGPGKGCLGLNVHPLLQDRVGGALEASPCVLGPTGTLLGAVGVSVVRPCGTGARGGTGAGKGLSHPLYPCGAWNAPGMAGAAPQLVFKGKDFQSCQCNELFLMLFAREGM